MARKDILSSSKKIKRKRKIFKSIVYFIVALLVAYGLVYLSNLSKFRIKNIKPESDNKILNEEIRKGVSGIIGGKYLKVLPKDNIFLLPKKEIEEYLTKEFPRIKSATVEVELPDTLLIKFEERKQEALLCYGKECGFLDKNGFVFEKAPYFSGDSYIKFIDEQGSDTSLAIGKNIIEASKFEKIIEFINLANKEKIVVNKVLIKSDSFFHLITKEGWSILISDKNEPSETIDNLTLTLKEKIKDKRKTLDYIDLRFGNKIYFKFK